MPVQATSSYKFVGVVTALSAIHQGGNKAGGTTDVINREKAVMPNGEVIYVPLITGNGVRGVLRRHGMKAMLEAVGSPVLPVGAFHFLTSGGALTKEAGRGLDIDEERRLRDLIPLASVFGGGVGRRILPGKLYVGDWTPICSEMRHLLPEAHQDIPHAFQSIMDMTDERSNSRMDEGKNVHWHKYLPEAQQALLVAPKVKIAKDGTEIAEKAGVAQQMRYSKEVLARGTKLSCWFQLNDVTQVEFEAFGTALLEWSKAPFIGGDAREGTGLVSLKFDNWFSVNPNALPDDTQAIGFPHGHDYHEHLQQRKEEIVQYLREMD